MEKWQRFQYMPCLPLGKDGRRATGSRAHIAVSREAACEGMVLLKNEGLLPFKKGQKIALFGIAGINYVKCGGGSGDVGSAYTRNLCDAMSIKEKEGKISVFSPLNEFYLQEYTKQKDVEPKVPKALLDSAKRFTDTAVVSISRYSAEGHDRTVEDFYLQDSENELLNFVTENFANVAVVLNIGGVIDASRLKKDSKIKSVLLGYQAGMEGGLAEADILCGDVNPSGKLADTFACSYDAYPSSYNYNESPDYSEYTEDIFVGYRYFETIPNKSDLVVYPFGYGLSYTTFEIKPLKANVRSGAITIKASIKNTGKFAGKEVLQVYSSAPGKVLEQPQKELRSFAKSKLLKPHEEQVLTLKFDINDMASFDDDGAIYKSAYVMEKGDYTIYLGTSVKDVQKVYTYTLKNNLVVKKLSSLAAPKKLPKRLLANGQYKTLQTSEYENSDVDTSNWPQKAEWKYIPIQPNDGNTKSEDEKVWFKDVAENSITLDEFIESLTNEDLIDLVGGRPNIGVANTFGLGDIKKRHIPPVMTADGPAGVRLYDSTGIKTTCFPCATLLASTWNTKIVEKVGSLGALEMKENNLGVWLTPAMNIHRNPLCGRNFEYYSEDPFLTGKIASAMIKGIQSQNIAATAKHFCCNSTENNRLENDSRVSERALREIYLKGFEIAVKESAPYAIMTSYNIVNGKRASENRDLITGILRNEWHYDGLVMTDWGNHAEHYKELIAGNNLRMPFPSGHRLLTALEQGLITRSDLENSAKKVLELILKLD